LFEKFILVAIRWSVPLILKNLIFISDFYFQSFLGGKREELIGFHHRKKLVVVMAPAIKTIYFCAKWFYVISEVKLDFFYLEISLKNKSELEKIFYFILIKTVFLHFWRLWIMFMLLNFAFQLMIIFLFKNLSF
jgi:hypothetical protein